MEELESGLPHSPRVFLSYAHDDDHHSHSVLELASLLEAQGIAVVVDKWYEDRRQDWYAWMLREIQSTDFVLVVASPGYRAVGDGAVPADTHRGVQAETAVLRDLLYRDRETWLGRVLPVVLPGRSLTELPTFTQPYSASHFLIDSISESGVEDLLRVLTGQPRYTRPSRGRVPVLTSSRMWPPAPPALAGWLESARRQLQPRRLLRPLGRSLRALPTGDSLTITTVGCLLAIGVIGTLFGLSVVAVLIIAATSVAVSVTVCPQSAGQEHNWPPPGWKVSSLVLIPLLAGIVATFPNAPITGTTIAATGRPNTPGNVQQSEQQHDTSDGSIAAAPTTETTSAHTGSGGTEAPGGRPTSGQANSDAGNDVGNEEGQQNQPVAPPGGDEASAAGSVDVVAVGHEFASDIDRLTITVRNGRPEPVLVERIEVLMMTSSHGWGDGGGWHFTVPGDMEAGDPGDDGSRRTHGLITMSGSQFEMPLVGQGWSDGEEWTRLLTFDPQKSLPASSTMPIVIDIPTTMLLQETSEDEPAGPMVEVELRPSKGSTTTLVGLTTPFGRAVACDYLRRPENSPRCEDIDVHAAVSLPNR